MKNWFVLLIMLLSTLPTSALVPDPGDLHATIVPLDHKLSTKPVKYKWFHFSDQGIAAAGCTNYGFELMNKTGDDITITMRLNIAGRLHSFMYDVPAKKKIALAFDTKRTVSLEVKQVKNTFYYTINNDDPDKTMYLTWRFPYDKEHKSFAAGRPYLFPQTGPLLGFSGVTNSNFSIKNNIDQRAILQQELLSPT